MTSRRGLTPAAAWVIATVAAVFTGCTTNAAGPPARFSNPPSLSTPRGYSQLAAVEPGSRLIFISGQVALDSSGKLVGKDDLRAQSVQVFENLKKALAAVGSTFADVVKLNFYLVDAGQIQVLREVRDQYVNASAPPASTLAEVRRLARDDFLVEIDAVAVARR